MIRSSHKLVHWYSERESKKYNYISLIMLTVQSDKCISFEEFLGVHRNPLDQPGRLALGRPTNVVPDWESKWPVVGIIR